MNAFRCLRGAARPTHSTCTLLRPRIAAPTPQRYVLMLPFPTPCPEQTFLSNTIHSSPLQTRHMSLLTPRRPTLARSSLLPPPGTSSPLLPCTGAETLDLAAKISQHPGLGSMQIRCGPRDTYNPSHLVRKRRHGFLSRIRTKKGRKLLMRRLKKGRWNLSH